MSLEQTACEDLKAFERRLTEVITCYQPYTFKWRFLLALLSICTLLSAYSWVTDPALLILPIKDTLYIHPFFTLSLTLLVAEDFVVKSSIRKRLTGFLLTAILFACGIHKKVLAPSIITSRTRLVLNDFNMSCDDTGKLILKPRPTVYSQVSGSNAS